MKLTAKHIGVLSVLLLNTTHAASAVDSNALNNVSNITEHSSTDEAVTIVAQPSHSEEIGVSLSEVKKAFHESSLAVVNVAHGVVEASKATFFIAKGMVNLTVSLARFSWFTGKILYFMGAITLEYAQSVFASK